LLHVCAGARKRHGPLHACVSPAPNLQSALAPAFAFALPFVGFALAGSAAIAPAAPPPLEPPAGGPALSSASPVLTRRCLISSERPLATNTPLSASQAAGSAS